MGIAKFEVIVGNIGNVYSGNNYMRARTLFTRYVKDSKRGYGRASQEPVTMLHNGEPTLEHNGGWCNSAL